MSQSYAEFVAAKRRVWTDSTFIYALVDPRDGECRYVGKSDSPQSRLRAHINDRAVCHRAREYGVHRTTLSKVKARTYRSTK